MAPGASASEAQAIAMKRFRKITLLLLGAILLVGGWWTYRLVWGRPTNLNLFYERVMIESVLDNPEMLTQLGFVDGTLLDFHSGKLTDASPRYIEKTLAMVQRQLEVLRSYPVAEQTPAQQLSTEILGWFLDDLVRGKPFRYHLYPVNQLFGVQSETPDLLINVHKVSSEKTAQRYVQRLAAFGQKFDGVIETLRLEARQGVIPPKFVLDRVLEEMRSFKGVPALSNALSTSFVARLAKLKEMDATRQDQLASAARLEIERTVYPAYGKLIDCVEELREKASTDDGVWKLPDGDAFYAYCLRSRTTTDYTPAQVHQMGLDEVRRIQTEMRTILDAQGLTGKSVAEQMRELGHEDRFLFPDSDDGRAQILTGFRSILEEVTQGLTNAFALVPKAGLNVERVPEFKQKTSAGAYYQPPAMDGSRPGTFFANLYDVRAQPKFAMRTLAYHEGVPGHHFQIALAQELQGVPTFRKVIPFTAYAEGWALYAEQLAWELGFQKDPYSNLGRLQAELFRAVRLVVDTGIHYKRWPRQQAIDYMTANTGMAESEVVAEVERYIVMPGQACAYKMGMMKILELRAKAKATLGDRFDLRAFHRVILGNGAVPLSTLERLVDQWISRTKTAAP